MQNMEQAILRMIAKNHIEEVQFSPNSIEREIEIAHAVQFIRMQKMEKDFQHKLLNYFNGNRVFQ